jgi:hypothetical protein
LLIICFILLFSQLLGHCQAVTDNPCNQFPEEFIVVYPHAKVILTSRPIDGWYNSVLSSIEKYRESWLGMIINLFHPDGRLTQSKTWKLWDWQWEGNFRANGKRIFVEHNERVRQLAGPENLLDFRVEQGWLVLIPFIILLPV